jgi:ABC-type tungstate transport system substrate-binding protein
MATLFGIDERRWLPSSRRERYQQNAHREGVHSSGEWHAGERRRALRAIWSIWTFRGGVMFIVLGLLYAVIPSRGGFGIFSWLVGIPLLVSGACLVLFQIVVGMKRARLAWSESRKEQ